MAYAIMHFFPGGTRTQYEASLAAVHPGKDQLPAGQIFHVAGPAPGGWQIVAVFDSEQNWARFRDGILMPRLQKGVQGGFPAPPTETTFEVQNLVQLHAAHT